MRPPVLPDIDNVKTFDKLKNFVNQNLKAYYSILNRGSLFTDQMNLAYVPNVELTSGVDNQISHNLDSVPIGYVVINKSLNADVWDGNIAWNTRTIFLRCSANVRISLFIIKG